MFRAIWWMLLCRVFVAALQGNLLVMPARTFTHNSKLGRIWLHTRQDTADTLHIYWSAEGPSDAGVTCCLGLCGSHLLLGPSMPRLSPGSTAGVSGRVGKPWHAHTCTGCTAGASLSSCWCS